MRRLRIIAPAVLLAVLAFLAFRLSAPAALRPQDKHFADWHADRPGLARRITAADLPQPFATPPVVQIPNIVPRPASAWPKLPKGFTAELLASGLDNPRQIKIAPNGDIFIAESKPGRIRVLYGGGADSPASAIFAQGLDMPFGMAFYPNGADPQYLYVGDSDAVLRFPYRNGDRVARGAPETVKSGMPVDGHWTRELLVTADNRHLLLSIGSLSNDAEGLARRDAASIERFEQTHGMGAVWGREEGRALVLSLDIGSGLATSFATGLRNCVGMALEPRSRQPWCTVNERDQFGDDLPSDFVTQLKEHAFYGWPWYYIGAHEDPNHRGERPDLAEVVTVPDVLLQAHSAPLGIAFYDGKQFPAAYRGDAFVALHGSYNRSHLTGYKVVRIRLSKGKPSGVYEDFMTGFIVDNDDVWARPVGVAVAADGALLVTDDANGTLWRITYAKGGETRSAASSSCCDSPSPAKRERVAPHSGAG
jgi:glucose/arabinose dehydrogenase